MKMKFKLLLNKIKQLFDKKPILMRTISIIIAILVLNQSIAVMTDVNIIGIGVKKFLNSLGIYTDAVPSVELKSSDWDSNVGGSWHIDKSAKWTGRGKAQVTFDLDTIVKTGENKKDVILVLDISGSMSGEKLERVKKDAEELVSFLLSDKDNSAALITFDTYAEILSDFTNNKENLLSQIQALSTKGNTNYNDALLKVEDILSDYVRKPNTDAVVLFLTDGYPCQDTPNQIGTFQILKDTYPFVTVNGIQYEMGSSIKQELIEVSDYQFYANMETLNNVLFEASISPEIYEKFEVVDIIDDDYFTVASKDDITVTVGSVELINESDGKQKIIWNLGDSFKSGSSAKMTINLKLKDQYLSNNGYYPTNKGEEVNSKLPSDSNEKNFDSSSTPVLKNNYVVNYDYNPPSGCSLKNTSEDHYVYENVTKKSDKPVCPGYVFKGWEIVEDDVTKVNDDVFIMPEHDVNIRGTWSTLTIAKNVDGEVHEDLTLFKQVKQDAETKNGASTYTGEVTDEVGKTVNTNIYYYTTATHNNLIFGGFCWQIVRTTATEGVKIVYNGVPSEGKCNNSGTAQQISTSAFNSNYKSPAYVGYMYNTVVEYKSKSSMSSAGTGMIFGSSVKNTSSGYELQDTATISSWSTDRTAVVNDHHYTCLSTTDTTCLKVAYVYYTSSSTAYYIELEVFSDVSQILEKMLSSNDVNAKDSDIKKVIDEWYANNMTDNTQYLEDTVFCNDRGISNYGGWNPNGGSTSSYLEFNNYSTKSTHVCPNETDQFAMSNSNAQLTYPVGLLTAPEASKMSSTFAKTGQYYWLGSPYNFYSNYAYERYVRTSGDLGTGYVDGSFGVRPAVSLNPGTGISSGNGTNDDPYIVEPVTK